jgi:hypothetical protein
VLRFSARLGDSAQLSGMPGFCGIAAATPVS